MNGGRTLHLNNLDYKQMASTYKCIVTGTGGQSDGSSTLEVYCKYSAGKLNSELSLCFSIIFLIGLL